MGSLFLLVGALWPSPAERAASRPGRMTRHPARLLALLFILLAGQCMPVPPPVGPAGALKLLVREDGLYRVTFDELRARPA
jgi:hypothetical protein